MAKAAVVIAGVSAAVSFVQQRKEAKRQRALADRQQAATERAERVESARRSLANARARRQQIARARRAQANITATQETRGGFDGSTFQGASGSLQGQLASTIGFSRSQERASQFVSQFQTEARNLGIEAQTPRFNTFSALSGVAQQFSRLQGT